MAIKDEQELFETQLKTLYNMEDQLVRAIPILASASTDSRLKEALETHLDITKLQRDRLEEIGRALEFDFKGKEDEALSKILESGQMIIQSIDDPMLKDNAIMAGTDKVEHYEMGAYNGTIALATKMKQDDVVDLLKESRDEEASAAKLIEALSGAEGLMGDIRKAVM